MASFSRLRASYANAALRAHQQYRAMANPRFNNNPSSPTSGP